MQHKEVQRWFPPWKARCTCGHRRPPCPSAAPRRTSVLAELAEDPRSGLTELEPGVYLGYLGRREP